MGMSKGAGQAQARTCPTPGLAACYGIGDGKGNEAAMVFSIVPCGRSMCQAADSALRRIDRSPNAFENAMSLHNVTPGAKAPEQFNVIIEIPMNADPIKYEVDKETGAMFVDRFMTTAMHYPCNYGYVPMTLAWCFPADRAHPAAARRGAAGRCPKIAGSPRTRDHP